MTITTRILSAVGLLLYICLPGCSTGPFSGSAAMRIEVEVYKGPLSLESELQLGELAGYLEEARNGLIRTKGFIDAVGASKNLAASKDLDVGQTSCEELHLQNALDILDCHILHALSLDAMQLINKIDTPLASLYRHSGAEPSKSTKTTEQKHTENESGYLPNLDYPNFQHQSVTGNQMTLSLPCQSSGGNGLMRILLEAHRIGASMQASGFRYETASTAGQSLDFKVRIAMVNFIAAASEYGNQIQARTDALLKQLCPDGRDRRELPLSVHLRETEPTDFVHLYKWLNATLPDSLLKYFIGSGTVEDRIKILDRLYSNHFWSKINTVYASGRGKTQMSFVKDDTGNWNLKSFDNDPSELLDAYTKVAKTALDGAVKVTMRLARDGASGGSSELAQQLLAIADQTALAKPTQSASSPGTLSLENLRTRARQQLDEKTLDSEKATDDRLKDEVDAAQTAYETAQTNKVPDEGNLKVALESKKKELAKHRQGALERWTKLIADHSNLVDLLGSTVKKK